MSQHRLNPDRGWANPKKMGRGPNGRLLCRRCNREVPKGRQTFCSNQCVDEWKMRSQPRFVRAKVFERDHGVCAICGVDTVKQVQELERIEGEILYKGSLLYRTVLSDNHRLMERLKELCIPVHRYMARRRRGIWDADHIKAVVEGGGECGLDNYRTLCCRCHKAETAALSGRLAKRRRTSGPHQLDLFASIQT